MERVTEAQKDQATDAGVLRWIESRALKVSDVIQRVATGIAVAARAARVAEDVAPPARPADGSRVFKIRSFVRPEAARRPKTASETGAIEGAAISDAAIAANRITADKVVPAISGDIELVSGDGHRMTARLVDQRTGESAELVAARDKILELEAEVRRYEQAHARGLEMWTRARDAAAPPDRASLPARLERMPRRSELVMWLLDQLSGEQQRLQVMLSERADMARVIEGKSDSYMIAKFASPLLKAGDLLDKIGALTEVPAAIAKLQGDLVQAKRALDDAKAKQTDRDHEIARLEGSCKSLRETRVRLREELVRARRERDEAKQDIVVLKSGAQTNPFEIAQRSFADLGKIIANNPVNFGAPIQDLANDRLFIEAVASNAGARYMLLCLQLRDLERLSLGSSWLADSIKEEADVLWREPQVRAYMGGGEPRHTGVWEPTFERGDQHIRLRDMLARAVRIHDERAAATR